MSEIAQSYLKEKDRIQQKLLSVLGKNPVGKVPQNILSETKETSHTTSLLAAIEKKYRYKPLRANHLRHRSHLDGLALSNKLQETASTELTARGYANNALDKSRAVSDISLPKIPIKYVLRRNIQPNRLPVKNLDFSGLRKSPNLPRIANNLQSELNNAGNRQPNYYSAEPSSSGEIARLNGDLQFFTVKPLGQQRQYRYIQDRQQNMSIHPHSDILAVKASIREQESRFETEKSKELSSIKHSYSQTLDNGNDNIYISELSDSRFISHPADISTDLFSINTNNIYKQRALAKMPTISQIKSEVVNYMKTSPGKKKEIEISPVLSIRKKLVV